MPEKAELRDEEEKVDLAKSDPVDFNDPQENYIEETVGFGKDHPMISKEEMSNCSSLPEEQPGKDDSPPKKEKSFLGRFCQNPDDLEKRAILKNIIVVSVIFLLTFTSYGSLAALQSSLHIQKGMGVINQAVLYAVMAVSCLFLPKIAIRVLGHKWCITVSLVGYVLWMAANGYGIWATMLPASILLGICASTLWTAQGSYFTILARHYARKTQQEPAPVTSFFFGIFVAVFAAYSLFGSVISSTALHNPSTENQTELENEEELGDVCGMNYCPETGLNGTRLVKPPPDLVWTLVGIDVALATLAVVISCVFVDPLPTSWIYDAASASLSNRQIALSSILATAKHMRRPVQVLLIPITVYSGMQAAFLDAEYTRSFVACFLAIWMVGWCLIPSAICRSISSFVIGRVVKYSGIIPIFIYGMSVDLIFQWTLVFWNPSTSHRALFFVVPIFCTLADSVWNSQIRALYGTLFHEDTAAAFSSFQFFNSCGCILAFSYSNFLCTRIKLYILMSTFAIGIILLFVVLIFFRKPKDKEKPLSVSRFPDIKKQADLDI